MGRTNQLSLVFIPIVDLTSVTYDVGFSMTTTQQANNGVEIMTDDELYRHLFNLDDSGTFRVSFPIRYLSIIGRWLPSDVRQTLAEAATAQYNLHTESNNDMHDPPAHL